MGQLWSGFRIFQKKTAFNSVKKKQKDQQMRLVEGYTILTAPDPTISSYCRHAAVPHH